MTGPIMKKFARFNPRRGNRRGNPCGYPRGYPRGFPIKTIFCCTFLSISLSAQTDSVYFIRAIPETTILEQRFSRTGYSVWQADSLPTLAVLSLSNRLFWENGLNLRQNAPGTLATISARGAGPNRTAVLWNGLSLQSPMNGVVDASLLPLWQGDRLEILQGGNSAAASSGAMGGTLLLETPLTGLRNGLSGDFGIAGGSFGREAVQGKLDYAAEKISSRLRTNWQSAANNFPFQKTGLNGQAFKTRQPNNFAEKIDIQQFNQVVVNNKNILKTAAWFQNSFRQIPPAITEITSDTWQRDRSGRVVLTWDYHPKQTSKWQTRLSWQDAYIAFNFANTTEESRAQTALLGTEWQKRFGRGTALRTGATAQRIRARSAGYQQQHAWYGQTRLAGFSELTQSFGHGGKVSALLRQEWASAQAAPFTWTLGCEVPFYSLGVFRGHVSRNFNIPTFNDRFWRSLGNADLVPEKGYSADLGWLLKKKHFSAELSAFQLMLDDWILWQPGADGLFRPGNLRKVSSRGLEASAGINFKHGDWKWKSKGHFQWSSTENTAVYDGMEAVLHKQLPYTPKVSSGIGLWVERAGFSGAYQHQFTGRRFVTSDNQVSLPGFHTGTLLLQYNLPAGFWRFSNSLSCHFTLENIWDAAYESIAYRPMPGRNWRVGILIGW